MSSAKCSVNFCVEYIAYGDRMWRRFQARLAFSFNLLVLDNLQRIQVGCRGGPSYGEMGSHLINSLSKIVILSNFLVLPMSLDSGRNL